MEWINVDDRLPEEYERVLSYNSWHEKIKVDYIVFAPDPIWACTLAHQMKVTHWMPLPEAPNPNNSDT